MAVFDPARGFKGFLDPAGIDSDQIWAKTGPPRPDSLPKLYFSAFWVSCICICHMHMPYAYGVCTRRLWEALGSSGGALGGSGGSAINFDCENLMFFATFPLKC